MSVVTFLENAVAANSATSPKSVAPSVARLPKASPMAPTAMLPHAPPAYCAVVMAPVHVATAVALMPRSDRKYGSAGVSMAMPK